MRKIGFDNKTYIEKQSREIKKRISDFGGKLYLEYGGKIFDDYHASRVLPGFAPDSKIQMLKNIGTDVEIIIVINASDIENNKIRGDLGISYDSDALRLADAMRENDLHVGSIVIAQYSGQVAVKAFKQKVEEFGLPVYVHNVIEGYPLDVQHIVSERGFGSNEYIQTSRPLVVVTAPGPGSGKMATCLSQLYHDFKRGISAGYAKFETFPVWNLPLKHPVNLAYEAATADLEDVNMIDPYHLEAYSITAVSYNRDVEVFPVLNTIFERIEGVSPYKSPTDMGVNMAGYCITDDNLVREASKDEIIRRYFNSMCDRRMGRCTDAVIEKIELLMKQAGISIDDREVVSHALERSAQTEDQPAMAIKLYDGRIITGKTSPLLGASAAALLNAVKAISGISKEKYLIDPAVIEPIQKLKVDVLGNRNPRLHSDEVLIALSISAATNPAASQALSCLKDLRGCEAHSTVILAQSDQETYRKLGINLTSEPKYQTKKLYHR